jgi:hypothetical protein
MSPGDRAALEGVLSALRPVLSIEVGTARGGSLARIAAHSETVHTFDLEPPPDLPPNATFHRGDSRTTLPVVLAELAREVDFALVDGEHTEAAVAADLSALLASPRVARAVILAHDSFHPAVRAGIEAVAGHEKVTNADLDFVPARMTKGGIFADQPWGGFAVLLVGIEAPRVEVGESALDFHPAARPRKSLLRR